MTEAKDRAPRGEDNNNTNNALPSHTPVCALGASAGGVTAIKSFFSNVRADLGPAYVVVVHLAPDHPSPLSEILASETAIPGIHP